MRILTLLMIWQVALAQELLACASCGSGGDDPLILYPNESIKVYAGATRSFDFENINPDGSKATAGGPELKDALRFAVGKSLGLRSFATLTLSEIINRRDGRIKQGFSDPSLSGRYTIILATMTEPWVPQVQILAGYKSNRARSIRGARDPDLLDVYGSGFSEYRVGIDLWYGLSDVKFGTAYIRSFSEPKAYDDVTYKPGDISRLTVTTGYMWFSFLKTMVGVNRENQAPSYASAEKLPQSEKLTHSYFINQDVQVDYSNMLRFSFAQQAGLLKNRNTARYKTMGLAYTRSW